MRKTLITLFAIIAGLVQAGDFYPMMYDPATGDVSYGTTNATTNTSFRTLNVGTLNITNAINVTTNWGWEDLRFPAGVAAPANPSADVTVDVANNSIIFETGCGTNRLTDDHIWGVAQMPHTWKTSSVVSAHIHFLQTNADQTNCWYMYYRLAPKGGARNPVWTFIGPATNYYSLGAGTNHQMAIFSGIATPNMNQSGIIDWKVFRLGSRGTGNIDLKEFDIHYQIATPTGEQLGL